VTPASSAHAAVEAVGADRSDARRAVSSRRRVPLNIIWNGTGWAVAIAAGFILAPFLVGRLGHEGYGLWILVGSFTNYFGLLDLGVRGSVGRTMAYYIGAGDWDRARQVMASATALLAAIGVLVLLLGLGLGFPLFFRVFDVPTPWVASTRLALVIVCVNLALSFPLQVFDGTLWALERFDQINRVDIAVTVSRTALSLWLVANGYGLPALAAITLISTILAGLAKALLGARNERRLALPWPRPALQASRELVSFGVWNFVLNASRMTRLQVTPMIIGNMLGIAAVTPFAAARRLQDYSNNIITATTGVVTPLATGLHARQEHDRQRELFLVGGKFASALASFFAVYFIVIGRPLIGLWMGPELAFAGGLLLILAVGEVMQAAQSVTANIILATAKHRPLAVLSLVETVVAVGGAMLAGRRWGLVGVCASLAIAQTCCTGLFQVWNGSRLARVPVATYVRRALSPGLASAIPAGVILYFLLGRWPADTWSRLLALTGVYGVLWLLGAFLLLDGWPIVRGMGGLFRERVSVGRLS
jgi:O-antigen/teichoic acid export membrane protein